VNAVKAEVVFAHTPTYPDEPPLVKARSLQGLDDADVRTLQALLEEQIDANMGISMIYTLVSAAQEWLNDKALALSGPSFDPEAERKRVQEAEDARIAALRAHGTPVTVETFAVWQERFEAERALSKATTSDAAAEGRPSGKQWFLQQEAQHLDIVEPELEDDETDGEGSRSQWSEEEFSDSDEDFIDSFLGDKDAVAT
jgi:RWD domain